MEFLLNLHVQSAILRVGHKVFFHRFHFPKVTHPAVFLSDSVCIKLYQGPVCSTAMI